MDILVVLEDSQGLLHRLSKEAIAAAQQIGGEVAAIAIGDNAFELADELNTYNLSEVIIVKNKLVSSYNADGYAEVLKQVIDTEKPKIIV